MTECILRALIHDKLVARRLPYIRISLIWGGRPGSGETCDGCKQGSSPADVLTARGAGRVSVHLVPSVAFP